ncbi:uncharacterized protein LOC127881884 [Dreissena polymorpha]|uniref:Flap endonuclease GEN homolog 1 n=1 Tax=Dreissena polymorpha TaxID=45954 RepID=A0A9D4MRX7_DREPO|nr:uncharacterized protein LOC127881884 [Dreissena polymorpha]KAH3882245.1 hypothetical protein DPMN_006179 [Dreissena polymorpha]
MGVTQLWQILAPVAEHKPLTALRGQTLAVDLSIWVCETQCVKQMQGIVSKPFLRNLFFRIVHLSQLGVRLVFVIEGSAPEIKWETMMKRQQTRFPGRQGKAGGGSKPAGSQNRRNFNACLKECCELLDILGIPYVQSKGEAEAMCALLNSAGLVDGCLTNDGDAFLYGAATVYRNFTMNAKDPHVEMYKMSDVEGKLGIDRGGLVALGLLIGCDFVPKGVPGIGAANAVKLLELLRGTDVLERLQQWRSMPESSCLAQVEVATRRKALGLSDFPQIKVINEFMIPKDRCPSRLSPWKRPVPAKLQEFALLKLEWPAEYTLEKVLPLTTLWDMQDILQSTNPSSHQHLKPHRIVKTRVRQGEPCFEVEWSKPVTDTLTEGSTYVTVECQDIFSRCYPHIVECYIGETDSKNKAKAGKKKKKKKKEASTAIDNLSFNFNKMNLTEVTNRLAQTVKDLPTEFNTYSECNLVTKAKQPKHLTLESVSAKTALEPKGTCTKRSESDQNKIKGFLNFDKNPVEAFAKPAKTEFKALTTSDGGYISLSERVKLRMQNKAVSCVNPKTSELSDLSSLLEEVENVSLSENKLKCLVPSVNSNSKINTKYPLHFTPVTGQLKAANQHTLHTREMSSIAQKMSSPFSANTCSPMSYIQQSLLAGGQSPIPKSSPSVNGFSFTTDSPSQQTPNVHKHVAEKCTAEKIAARLESGIMKIGKPQQNDWKSFSFFDKAETLPKCNTSTEKTPISASVKDYAKTTKSVNQSLLDFSSLGLDASQFGNFEIQTSLLNSLCSSLIQALTPKGVSMSKEEYESLMSTLNEINKDDEIPNSNQEKGQVVDELACAIDFSDIEKASSELKKMKTAVTLDPIRLVGDAQVVDNVEARSKSARKKLRRKEKRRALEDIAHLNNMSQRIMNNHSDQTQNKQGKKVDIGKYENMSLSEQKMAAPANRTTNYICEGNRKLSSNEVDLTLAKTEPDKCKSTECSKVNDRSARSVSSNGSSIETNSLLKDKNTSKCKSETRNVTSCLENKTVPTKSQVAAPSTTGNSNKCAAENGLKSASEIQKVVTLKRETTDSKEKQKAKSDGKEPLKSAGKPCSTSYSCHKAHNSPESASENKSRPNIGKPGLVMAPFTVSKSPCPITSPQKDAKRAGKVFPSPSICKNILSEMDGLFDRDERKKDADMDSVSSGDLVSVKKKKKKKKVKKASSLVNMSASTSSPLCGEYLKHALEKFKGEKVIQKASPVFDLSADESILELESLSSKLVGVRVEKEKAIRLTLLKARQMLAEKEISSIMTDVVTEIAPVLQLETACQPSKTSKRSDNNEEATVHRDMKTSIPVGLEDVDIFDKSCLPNFEKILDLDDVRDNENEFGKAKSTSSSHWEELEENTKEGVKPQCEENECWGKDYAFAANGQGADHYVAYSDQVEHSDSEFEGSDVSDQGGFALDQTNDVGMICYHESSTDKMKEQFEADDKNGIQNAGFQKIGKVNADTCSKETHNLIFSLIRPKEAFTDEESKVIDEKKISLTDIDDIEIVKKGKQPDQSPDRNNTIWTVEDLSLHSIGHEHRDNKSLPVYGKMQFDDELTEKYESADEEIFVDAGGETSLDKGIENVDMANIRVCESVNKPDENYTKSKENGTVIEKENYACQSIAIEPVSIQSPACLAERLKLRLQKKSVRSVLETFTNGKFE